jgi:hypothetical protein
MDTSPRLVGLLVAIQYFGCALAAADSENLIEAAKYGDITAVAEALKSDADVNAGGPDGTTALQLAAHSNRAAVVELLLKAQRWNGPGWKPNKSSAFRSVAGPII